MDDLFGVDDIFEAARKAPHAFLTHILPAVVRAAEATVYQQENDLPRDAIWSFRMKSEYVSLNVAYISACEAAFKILANENPDSLRPFIATLLYSRTFTANSLLLGSYLEGETRFAEDAMRLLCAEPARLYCGYSDSPPLDQQVPDRKALTALFHCDF
jgi:hypothetical protein